MRVVVADTGPLHYLVLIGEIELLPRLFGTVSTPERVRAELCHMRTPPTVRAWMSDPPAWIRIMPTPPIATLPLPSLDDGERAALALAASLGAELILIDDRDGVTAALAQGFEAIGTLGILDRAARRGLVDLAAAFARLRTTNFRCRQELLDELLARYEADRKISRHC